MHGALHAAAHDRAAAGDVDCVCDQSRAEAMARRRHRGVLLPGIGGGVVGLHLAEDAVGAFAAHHEDLFAVEHRAVAGAGGRQRVFGRPFVGRRIIGVMQVRVGVE